MTIFERHMWACDRLYHCRGALDACTDAEMGFWARAVLYYLAVIDYLEELM